MTVTNSNQFDKEHAAGERFGFGDNWRDFLSNLNDERIDVAVQSLQSMLEIDTLAGKSFLDIGSGSGLFSLAARKLGAKVTSFDYDPNSVWCTAELRRRYFRTDSNWTVERGSVLDLDYLQKLGQFDIVYSWGVLHHTGKMWQALDNVDLCVLKSGKLFISLYNDQGWPSIGWAWLKRTYCHSPKLMQTTIAALSAIRLWGPKTIKDFLKFKPFETWRTYQKQRGMSPWHDVIDWVGGYPFEVSKPEQIFDFYKNKGYNLNKLKTCGGKLGCNEFVFTKHL